MFKEIIILVLSAGVVIGSVVNLIGAFGFIRFKNFYIRLHSSTLAIIGGTFYPIIILSFISSINGNTFNGSILLFSSLLIFILSPTGTHALARAAYFTKVAKPEPIVRDDLKGD